MLVHTEVGTLFLMNCRVRWRKMWWTWLLHWWQDRSQDGHSLHSWAVPCSASLQAARATFFHAIPSKCPTSCFALTMLGLLLSSPPHFTLQSTIPSCVTLSSVTSTWASSLSSGFRPSCSPSCLCSKTLNSEPSGHLYSLGWESLVWLQFCTSSSSSGTFQRLSTQRVMSFSWACSTGSGPSCMPLGSQSGGSLVSLILLATAISSSMYWWWPGHTLIIVLGLSTSSGGTWKDAEQGTVMARSLW